jgi:hypothetical protein
MQIENTIEVGRGQTKNYAQTTDPRDDADMSVVMLEQAPTRGAQTRTERQIDGEPGRKKSQG